MFDHLDFFMLCAEFGGRLDAEALTQFVDAGGNVLVAGSNIIGRKFPSIISFHIRGKLGDAIREFAGECGIEFADDNTAVIDHLNYDVNDNGQVRIELLSIGEE
jgi:oligosaccharyltransferase complex subunit beta